MILAIVPIAAGAATPAVVGRGDHTLVLKSDGALAGWGRDSDGQLATGNSVYSATPRAVQDLPSIQAVSVYSEHVLALDTQGNVWAWGSNRFGELGRRTQRNATLPDRVQGISNVSAVATTNTFSVALKRDGTVWVWGGGSYGEIAFSITLDPIQVQGLSDIVQISGGLQHVLARKRDGTVMAFGLNLQGQLGNGSFNSSMTPTLVSGLPPVVDVAAGANASVAVTADGELWAWGRLSADERQSAHPSPHAFPSPPSKPVHVAAGNLGYAVSQDGSVWRFADDVAGIEQIQGLTDIVSAGISRGAESFVGVTSHATLVTFSSNAFGEAGVGNTNNLFSIPTFAPLSGVIQAAFGTDLVAAVTANGKVWIWGRNTEGALALGAAIMYSTPLSIGGLPQISKVVAGVRSSAALDVNGNVWAWGTNEGIGVGLGTATPNSQPQQVAISGVIDIAAGWTHFLYLKSDGTVWAAGSAPGLNSLSPVQLQGLPAISKIAGGFATSFFVDAAGNLYAMGANSAGELGDGTLQDRGTPVRITAIPEPVVQVASDFRISFAVTSSGAVYEWGYLRGYQNAYSQFEPVPTPQRDPAFSNVVELAVTQTHFLARLADGRVMSWGGTNPEVNGRDGADYPPGFVADLDSVISIGANSQGSYAIRSDGTVWGWGPNTVTNSLVGDGTFTLRPRPVVVLREGGAGSLDTQNWYLDSMPGVAKAIPSNKIPALVASASASDLSAVASVDANLKFRSQDIGKGIHVFAYAPASLVKPAKDGADCVLAQLTTSGLQQVSAASLVAVGTIASSQQAAVTVLNNVATSQIAGSTFCIGSGQTGAEAVATANSQCVVSVPGPSTCPAPTSAVVANLAGPLSGLWWNSAESGWGIHFTQRRNIVFAAWYIYDASGNPKWYVSTCAMAGGSTGSTGTCDGTLYEVNGPTFFNPPFDTSLVHAANAGTLQVTFQNADSASMTYSGVAGQTRTVAIARQPLASGTAAGVNYTDLWWGGQSQSGWGIAITQQASTMFLAWYVYDNSAKPMWYVATCTLSGATCAGDLLRTTGPAFGPAFNSSQVHTFTAGSVSVTFTDGNNATLSYTVNGVSASKTITRQLF